MVQGKSSFPIRTANQNCTSTMSWRIWNLSLKWSLRTCYCSLEWSFGTLNAYCTTPTNRWHSVQLKFNLDLKWSLWRCYVSHSLEWKFGNINASRDKLFEKNSHSRYTQPEFKFTFTKTPKWSFFFLIQIKRVHTMKWSSNCSQYMFPRSSEFFEFACIKLIPRCIIQINCEEYKHMGLLSEKKMKGSCAGIFPFLHLI